MSGKTSLVALSILCHPCVVQSHEVEEVKLPLSSSTWLNFSHAQIYVCMPLILVHATKFPTQTGDQHRSTLTACSFSSRISGCRCKIMRASCKQKQKKRAVEHRSQATTARKKKLPQPLLYLNQTSTLASQRV
ncbi:MAG: hypothetical protein BYD32DRAFT_291392 [Podila humilis]|nr:MAG: hypothetical protein BYD32DRAFT_291392 [Podila humilis]